MVRATGTPSSPAVRASPPIASTRVPNGVRWISRLPASTTSSMIPAISVNRPLPGKR